MRVWRYIKSRRTKIVFSICMNLRMTFIASQPTTSSCSYIHIPTSKYKTWNTFVPVLYVYILYSLVNLQITRLANLSISKWDDQSGKLTNQKIRKIKKIQVLTTCGEFSYFAFFELNGWLISWLHLCYFAEMNRHKFDLDRCGIDNSSQTMTKACIMKVKDRTL